MNLTERNIHIADLQTDHAEYVKSLVRKLELGTACDLSENAVIHYLIRVWYRYEPLSDSDNSTLTQAEQVIALNNHNCLTYAQMCSIRNYIKQLTKDCR